MSTAAAPVESDDHVVLAEGSVSVQPGEQLPETAEVFAWPANEALAELEVGDQFNLEPVGTADVEADGSFEVVVEEGEDLERFASDFGELNLFVSADNGAEAFEESFTVELDSIESQADDGAAVVDLGEIESTGTIEAGDVGDEAAAPVEYIEKACTSTKVTNHGNKWVPIGGLFSTNSGTTIDFEYSAGQSTTLGAAVSAKSSTAGFSASGTTSVSSTATINYPAMSGTGSKLARTQFRYGTYKTTCTFVTGGVASVSTSYKLRADMWVGGTSFSTVSAPTANYCTNYVKGSTFTKSNSKQVTWTGAVVLLGASLSAQTGWSTNGKLVVDFASKGGRLCGSGNYPTQSNAYQLVAKS